MSITVAQALRVGALQRGQVLAGQRGLQRLIEHVTVLETPLPDDPAWLRGQELCITNFWCVQDDRQAQLRAIATLARRQSAGLIYQPVLDHHLVPEVLDLADRLAFPLIEIPPGIAYTEIITPVTALILNMQTNALERLQAQQRQLIDLLLRGFGLEHLIQAIAGQVQQPVLLLNAQGVVETAAGLDHPQQSAWRECVIRMRARHPQVLDLAAPRAPGERLLVHPLFGGQQCFGWLVTRHSPDSGREQQALLEQAVTLLALELLKQETLLATQRNLQRDFLEELLANRWSTDEQVLREAARIGWDLQSCRAVLIVRESRAQTHAAGLQQRAGTLLYQVSRFVRQASPSSVVCQRGDEVLVLASLRGSPAGPATPADLARALHQTLVDSGQRQCVIACGSVGDSVRALAVSYREALRALQVRHQLPGNPAIIGYEEAQLLILLSDFAERPEVQTWLQRQMGALIDYDRRNKTSLVQTLEVALDQGGLLNVTADLLSIHPNTLKYRLQRIEEILALNPLSSDHRLTYHIATKLARLCP